MGRGRGLRQPPSWKPLRPGEEPLEWPRAQRGPCGSPLRWTQGLLCLGEVPSPAPCDRQPKPCNDKRSRNWPKRDSCPSQRCERPAPGQKPQPISRRRHHYRSSPACQDRQWLPRVLNQVEAVAEALRGRPLPVELEDDLSQSPLASRRHV